MHRLPSRSVLWRYRIASFLLIFKMLGLLVGIGLLGYGFWMHDVYWITLSGVCFGVLFVLLILNFIITIRLRCPLCLVQPFLNRGCSKHRDVKRIFGSHKLLVATTILTLGHFTCPYCGEQTAMVLRRRLR
jgi:hypothetical protein